MADNDRSAGKMANVPVACTAIDNDWGDGQPHLLMHPPCVCPRCAPDVSEEIDDGNSWLQIPGQKQRLRVEPAELGAIGQDLLG